MRTQAGRADVGASALRAGKRPLVGVKALVQLQMDELRERQVAEVARIRPLTVVQPKVRLQVARGAEPLIAHVALMWPFA